MFRAIVAALWSRNYRILLGTMLIFFGIASTLAVFDMLVNTYFWKLTGEQLSLLSLVGISGPVLAFVSVRWIQQHFQKHRILMAALITQMGLSLLVVTLRLGGFFPDNDNALFLPLLAIVTAFQAFISALSMICVLSMFADLIDEQEHQTGQRQEGVFASGIALATKMIGSVGVVIGGVLVDHFIGLPRGAPSTEIGEEVIFRLAITDAVIVNLFILIPAWLISKYSLTSQRMTDIQRDLELRRN